MDIGLEKEQEDIGVDPKDIKEAIWDNTDLKIQLEEAKRIEDVMKLQLEEEEKIRGLTWKLLVLERKLRSQKIM